jgi:hypothetical protein
VLKIVLKTFFGLLISVFGFSLVFLYLIKIEENFSFLLLLPAVLLIIVGAYILIKAGKSDVTVIKKPDMPLVKKDNSNAALEEIFDKNNKLSSEWASTVEKRDRLKLLEISGAAEEQGD